MRSFAIAQDDIVTPSFSRARNGWWLSKTQICPSLAGRIARLAIPSQITPLVSMMLTFIFLLYHISPQQFRRFLISEAIAIRVWLFLKRVMQIGRASCRERV